MFSRKILASIAVSVSILFVGLNCWADISPGELAKASEARAVATSSDPLTTDLIEKKVKEATQLLQVYKQVLQKEETEKEAAKRAKMIDRRSI